MGGGNGKGGWEFGSVLICGSCAAGECRWRGELTRGNLHWVKLWELVEEELEEEDSAYEDFESRGR